MKTYVLHKVKFPSEIYYYKPLFIFTVASIMAANTQTEKTLHRPKMKQCHQTGKSIIL